MEDTKTAQNAVDIIYELPAQLAAILDEVRAVKARNAILEAKLNSVATELAKTRAELSKHQAAPTVPVAPAPAPTPTAASAPAAQDEQEVMEAVTRAPPAAVPGTKGGPASLPQKVTIPQQDIDPLRASTPTTPTASKAATHVRGRIKDRDGAGAAGVEIKIMTIDNNLVKKTKTSAGGVWLAFLQPGEYTVEFTKPGQRSPMFKSLIIKEGQREVDLIT